jgi:acetoacetate decarboxylase
MTEDEVKSRAFAMPLTSPAFPPGPYRFVNREFLIITYRTDPEVLRAVIPAPLEFTQPVVKYEFIRMPDSTGFGRPDARARNRDPRLPRPIGALP